MPGWLLAGSGTVMLPRWRLVDHLLAGDVDSEGYYRCVDDYDPDDWAELLVLTGHPDPDVRRAVVETLPLVLSEPPQRAVGAVIELTSDEVVAVRDHACFVLGQQWREVDTPLLREALATRLDDLDRNTRNEALLGLAYRRDPRAAPRVRAALARESGDVWRLELVAAGALGDPRLHPFVLRHLDGWDEADSQTVDAVRRLTDPAGPGADLFRGVAGLYREGGCERSTIEPLEAWHLMMEMLDIAPDRTQELFDAVLTRVAGDEAAQHRLRTQSALSTMLEP